MATFTTRKTVSTRHEWIVPATEPWGAPAEEVSKAWVIAEVAYREAHDLPEDAALSGDALRFHVTDDALVIDTPT